MEERRQQGAISKREARKNVHMDKKVPEE